MMSRMLGAPLGGTTVGGHHGLESVAVSSITPPNFGSGGGSCFPSIVVVAPGDPGVPVVCCAKEGHAKMSAIKLTPKAVMPERAEFSDRFFMGGTPGVDDWRPGIRSRGRHKSIQTNPRRRHRCYWAGG